MAWTLKDFTKHVESQSSRQGKAAKAELDAYRAYFRVARQLAERRLELGLTQGELAKRSGVPQSEISRIETGNGNPTVRTLAALAKILKADLAVIPRDKKTGRASKKTPKAA
jgi:DNA-binding XRE family transcriptional regulator